MCYAERKLFVFSVLLFAFATHQKCVDACGGCGSGPSPVDGEWGSWGSWSSCRRGSKTRYRYCNNPSPSNGGRGCSGRSKESKSCYYNPCSSARCQHFCISSGGVTRCRCSSGYVTSPYDPRKCVRNSCQGLTAPINGGIWPKRCLTSPTHGDSCFFKCKTGYKGVGISTKNCNRGNWDSSASFHCEVKDCPPLNKPDRGGVTPQECQAKPLHGQKCSYECDPGYQVIGPNEVTCDDGRWTGSIVHCKDIQAPSFNETCPSNLSVLADEGQTSATVSWGPVIATDNDRALVTVTPNVISPYAFSEGGHTLAYKATDPSGNKRFCHFRVTVVVLRCAVLFPPANGKLENEACGNVHGRVCRFSCNKGYELRGSIKRKCERKKDIKAVYWTGNTTYCEAIRCLTPNTSENEIQTGYGCTGPSSFYGASCLFSCKLGYEAVRGSSRRTCLETTQWSGTQLECQAITCPHFAVKSEGLDTSPALCTNSSAAIQYLQECRFTCKEGYQQDGPGIKICGWSKTWIPLGNPSCRDIRGPEFFNCPSDIKKYADRGATSTQVTWSPPAATDNSGFTPDITHFGKLPGESFSSGEHMIRYLASDKSGNVAECRFKVFVSVIRCVPRLYAPAGGTIRCTKDNQYGSECSINCHTGRTLTGSALRVCEKDPGSSVGFWKGNDTSCELVQCPRLVPPPHSLQSGCGAGSINNLFGDKCLFYCDVGNQMINGSKERTCQANGTWSGEAPHCQVVQCRPLQAPKDGDVSPSSCKAVPKYDTTCRFTCQKGYRLSGWPVVSCLSSGEWSRNTTTLCKDVDSPSFGLTCTRDIRKYADWARNYTTITWPPVIASDNSGKEPNVTSSGVASIYYIGKHQVFYNATDQAGNYKICTFYIIVEVLRCQTLLPPLNGFFVGDCVSAYGYTCRINCNDGYHLIGSDNVTCLHKPRHIIGYWNKPSAICRARSCSSLSAPQHGFLYPHMCKSFPVSGTTCFFECKHGYQSNGGVSRMQCGLDGKWYGTQSLLLKCVDVTSPIFLSCPSDIRVSLGVNSTVMANWTEPVAWDNSNLMPNITVDPSGLRPPYIFNKTTLVVYTAMDGSGNKKQCSFKVILEDKLSPEVVYCPVDQSITATAMKSVVTWDEPQFKDNSNDPLTIRCSHRSGTEFYWGTWNVHCTAQDNNPNNRPALCQFTLTIKPKDCPNLSPPQNGAKACDDWMFGRMCSPFCNNGWDFAQKLQSNLRTCGASGSWSPTDRWPDCSEINRASSVRMEMHLHYLSGDNNSPEARADIALNFNQALKISVFKDFCQDPSLKDNCRTENVKVTGADVQFTTSRGRREIFMYPVLGAVNGAHHRERRSVSRTAITADIVVYLDGIQANSTKEGQIMVGEEGMKIAKNMSSLLKSAVNNGSLVLSINGSDIKPDKQSLNISEPKCICSRGQVYKDGYCLNCTVGTYLNKTTGNCEDCPIGTYQEYEGEEQCLACPPKTSTIESRTGNRSSCLALCKAGSFSPTGLEPCIACDKGLYQEMAGQRQCLKCSVNKTTPAEGSNNSTQCGVPCSPGSFSPTGLAPCISCDRRSFQPLPESRACFSCPGTTATVNPGSSNGQDCIEINECDSSPCKSNSTCTDLIGDFLCSCQPGYTGKECDTNIDECKDKPCFNNGTCHDLVNNYTCSCAQGYQGLNCNEDVDECTSSPCPENATCENLPGRYKCQCEPGFTGSLCISDLDDCLTSPCQNGATCTDQINYYECLCPSGFQGNDCEENINDCANNSCRNGGICRDGINSYNCVCPAGFSGTECEYDIDECAGADCQNNATCIDEVNGFLCICNKGFSGVSCEINIDECFSNPCKNQATCLDMVNGYNCKCPDGFDGLHCENNIDDCATFPCSNNGSCKDGVNSFSCVCPPGFTGKICNMDIDFCASMPCLNNGSCFDGVTSFTCECADGFDGELCQTNMDNCINATCINNSTCIDGIAEFRCACTEGFAGANCEINIDDCEQNPCLNDGICTDMTDDYRCNCARGYTGKNCSINIDECSNSPCYNNATCVDKVDNYTCVCLNGFSGRHCELDIDDCLMNPCSNSSTCKDGLNSYTCHCEPGFTGDSCDVDINECSSFPCYYGGKCYDQVNGFTCVCPTGFTGSRCEVNVNDCESHACVNDGICLDLIANYSCLCPDGFSGSHCEKLVDYCREANCTANGYCVNSRTGYYCNCSAGYYGKYCEFETDECLTRPCFNNATCHDANNNFSCSCLDGFTGKYCEVDINDCVENTCMNNATCIDETPGYYCVCPAGYNGIYCQTEINECESNPCSNNGTCTDLTPGYNCKCADQFYGENCESLIDVCQSAPCQHGGTCNADNSTGNYTCSCLGGFTGFACEVDIDDCTPDRCPANAFCIDLVNDFRCECFPSYLGDRCEIFLGSNFDLLFKRQSSKDMVLLPDGKNIPSMTGFTIAQFVQADSKYKSGTLFSYSVPENPEDIIIISFIESQIILEIKNEEVRADFRLADDHWHFVGVTWGGGLGSASVYIDGMEIKEVSNLQAENIIRGGGWIVLGQRYLAEEKITALSSAFVGRLHQVSIWNVAATRDHMWNAAHDCSWPIAGSLRAWSSFLPGIKGQVEKRFMTQCKALKMCTTNCSHFLHCESRGGFYFCSCQAGFTGAHCNININDCSPNSCLNGKCVDEVNRFECFCNKGYYGKNCEKKIVSEGECPDFKQPQNGKVSCHKVSGQMLCILSCDEGFSFSAEAITQYSCGPESEWKWNGMEEVQVPTCLRKAPPMEIKHDFSIKFPGMQCSSSQNHKELRTAIKSEIRDTLLTVQGCQSCQLQEVKVPECEISANRKRKAVEQATEVIFSLIVSKATDAYENDVEEKNEAVLFQMTSAVATGQFVINLNGINISADRSSFQVLRSSVTCRTGFLMSRDGKGCVACLVGTFHDQGSSRCRPCAQGSYQDKEGQSVCTVCGEGKSTSITGATSSNDCSYDEDSVNIYVIIATVTACVTVVIILGVIIACKRFCTCTSNRFKKNRVSDSSSNLRLPLSELINSVGEKNNSGEKYQLHDKTPDVKVSQKSIS